ncbi:MAG: ABC transporter ATP-binding protein [Acidisphaera sp.]|nr:ABC transporter ATP-binding protein [Acidisphaera sp.]
MSRLTLDRLGKRYGDAMAADSVSLDIPQGEMVVLLGPSGCGKTTTLRMVAGFVTPTSGDVLLDGRSILRLPPHRREMGLVFQNYALFPHLSVARNVAFGLEMRGTPRPEREAQVQRMLELARLEALAERLPRALSGGQQQRVALVRALAIQPRVLLLDEPLSNLDAALRAEVGRDIRLLQREAGLTTVMVTHDQDEAMAMADRLVLMRDGRVQQTGTQEDLYERPANPFVAGFIGRSTVLRGTLHATMHGGDVFATGGGTLLLAGRYAADGACTVALRPERLRLAPPGEAGPGSAAGTVELASYLGAVREHLVRLGPELRLVVRDPTAGNTRLHAPGDAVAVRWDAGAERVFDAADAQLPFLHPEPIAPDTLGTRMTSDA